MAVYKRPKPLLALDTLLNVIIVVSLLSVAVLMFVQVALRYVLNLPLMGIEELCYFPTTWLFLFAAVKASSEKSQLVARVLEIFCKRQRSVYWLRTLAAILSSAILLWLSYWAYDYFRYALRMQKLTSSLYLPQIYSEGAVFIAFFLMGLYSVVEIYETIRNAIATPASEPVAKMT